MNIIYEHEVNACYNFTSDNAVIDRSCMHLDAMHLKHFSILWAPCLSLEEEYNPVEIGLSSFGDEAVEEWVGQAVQGGDGSADLVRIEIPFRFQTLIQHDAEKHHDVDGPEAEHQTEENHRQ